MPWLRKRHASGAAPHMLFPVIVALLCSNPAFGGGSCKDPSTFDPSKTVTLHVIDVGHGDAMAIVCQDGAIGMVVDGGDQRDPFGVARFKERMKSYADASPAGAKVRLVVATHQDSDHIGGLSWLLDGFKVDTFVDNGRPSNSKAYMNLHARVLELQSGGRLKYLRAGTEGVFEICPGVKVTVVTPPRFFKTCISQNNCSIVTRVDYGKVSFILTGDADRAQEGALLEGARAPLKADLLKVGHHGSNSSSGPAFLKAVSPGCAVISSGKTDEGTNAHHHLPRENIVKRVLGSIGMERPGSGNIRAWDNKSGAWVEMAFQKCFFSTASDGTVSFSSDGKNLGCAFSGGR